MWKVCCLKFDPCLLILYHFMCYTSKHRNSPFPVFKDMVPQYQRQICWRHPTNHPWTFPEVAIFQALPFDWMRIRNIDTRPGSWEEFVVFFQMGRNQRFLEVFRLLDFPGFFNHKKNRLELKTDWYCRFFPDVFFSNHVYFIVCIGILLIVSSTSHPLRS